MNMDQAYWSPTEINCVLSVLHAVQPNAPENVTVSVVETEESPHLLVKWEPPHEADTRSGWITLTYQLRVKRQNKKESEWEVCVWMGYSIE